MLSLACAVGAPADEIGASWCSRYVHFLAQTIKNLLARCMKVLCGPCAGKQSDLSDMGDDPHAELIERYLSPTSVCAGSANPLAGGFGFHMHCCAGIDSPGVGRVHSFDCPVAPGDAWPRRVVAEVPDVSDSLRRLLNDEPPAPLPWRERDDSAPALAGAMTRQLLLAQLVGLARDLAQKNLRAGRVLAQDPITGADITSSGCTECLMYEHLGRQPHTPSCTTGRMLALLAELARLGEVSVSNSNGKEVASVEEMGGAGDGIRSRAALDFGEPWEPSVDEFGYVKIYDRNGQLVINVWPSHECVGKSVGQRITDCVNSCAPSEGGAR